MTVSFCNTPRLVIAGLSGGSGKTMLSVGLARAFARRGLRVQTFKKGPDYIDTLWAALACGCKPRNLDPFMAPPMGSSAHSSAHPAAGSLPALFASACAKFQAGFTEPALFAPACAKFEANVTGNDGLLAGRAAKAEQGNAAGAGLAAGSGPDLAIIEGNRGLFDGQDLAGSCSSAELARQLQAPVVLLLNCAKMTRTAAALVLGCKHFEPGLNLGGVILNRVSRERHRNMLRAAIEELAKVPVFGAVPPMPQEPFAECRNGLLSEEAVLGSPEAFRRLDALADLLEAHVNLDALLALARSAPELEIAESPPDLEIAESPTGPESAENQSGPEVTLAPSVQSVQSGLEIVNPRPELDSAELRPNLEIAAKQIAKPRIGYVRDKAFWFYYTENLEALELAGAELVRVSLLDSAPWPELDGLYVGGGLPEEYAAALSGARVGEKSDVVDRNEQADRPLRRDLLRGLAQGGLPIYAEGNSLYYFGQELRLNGRAFPMSGIFDFSVTSGQIARGLGYVQAVVERPNPYHPVGAQLRGHEFHYASLELPENIEHSLLLRLDKGCGLNGGVQNGAEQNSAAQSGCGLNGVPSKGEGQSGCGLNGVPSKGEGQSGARDGLLYKNCFAALTQIFAPGTPHWAANFVAAARAYKAGRGRD